MYVGESIGRWLAFILQPGGLNRDMPIPPAPAYIAKWISLMDLIARARTSSEHRFLLDRNESMSYYLSHISFRSQHGQPDARVPARRNRAGSRAIGKREKRDREADNA